MLARMVAVTIAIALGPGFPLKAAAQVVVGEVIPAPAARSAPATPLPEALLKGLRMAYACDGDLAWIDALGTGGEARFARNSEAWTPTFERLERQQPRFVAGRFGSAVFVENGLASPAPLSSRNLLSSTVAALDVLPAGVKQEAASTVPGVQEKALALAGAVTFSGPSLAIEQPYLWSLYVQGEAGATLSLQVRSEPVAAPPAATADDLAKALEGLGDLDPLADAVEDAPAAAANAGAPPLLAETTVTLRGGWERVHLAMTPKDFPPSAMDLDNPGQTLPLRLTVEPGAASAVQIDAMMLEAIQGYAGRATPSSWQPGGSARDGEILQLAREVDPAAGTLAFWTYPEGRLGWRCLAAVGDDNGWNLPLRLDLINDRTLRLVCGMKLSITAPWTPDTWHHIAIRWSGTAITVSLDGEPVATLEGDRPIQGGLHLGGVATNHSPGIRADARFDEVLVWDRALEDDAVRALAARSSSAVDALPGDLTLADREPLATYARDDLQRLWQVRLTNRSAHPLTDVAVALSLDGREVLQQTLPLALPSGSHVALALPWSPSALAVGPHRVAISVASGTERAVLTREIRIVPARPPLDQAQVIVWGAAPSDAPSLGITAAGTMYMEPAAVENAVAQGLYVMAHVRFHGESGLARARMIDLTGRPSQVDQIDPDTLLDLDRKIADTVAQLQRFPDVRFLNFNSEHQTITNPDFRPASVAQARDQFGLDLTPWRDLNLTPDTLFRALHPGGRLSPRAIGLQPPADGLVPADAPLLRYHRWWHQHAGTEVALNEAIATGIRRALPDLQALVEPALRRPSIRAYREQDILQSWFYYPDPTTTIWTQERLAAMARGTRAAVTGMPQFLFKPGMAAPYGGMPTPHLFRETVWLCLARPMEHLSYWNLEGAVEQGSTAKTQAEIDAKLGPTPTWESAAAKVTATSEASSLFLFIPELKAEIARLHRETVDPLRPLLPHWRNRPRKIAVYQSFAGELFSEVRWTYASPLSAQVKRLMVPYDVLFDTDFEQHPTLLDGYEMVIIPESPVITAAAGAALQRWQAAGGTVVADANFLPQWEGLQRPPIAGAPPSEAALAAKATELERRYGSREHPQFVEGMEQYVEAGMSAAESQDWLRNLVSQTVHLDATVDLPDVYLNTLQAAGANYLVAVNDRRVPGPHYGHFGRVLEDGVAQAAELRFPASWGRHVYDLMEHRAVALETGEPVRGEGDANTDSGGPEDGGPPCRVRAALAAAGGVVYLILPRAIERLEANIAQQTEGETVYTLRLVDAQGEAVPGLIPVAITERRGDAEHVAMVPLTNGSGRYIYRAAYGGQAGATLSLTARDMASGTAITLPLPAGEAR